MSQPMVPRFSIAMATYNGEAHLQDQLDSILAQDLPPFELHVGDDGSTDRTQEILRRFQSEAPFPVHITINEVRLGFADNFLTTAARCSGDWIVFCDQDDVWLRNRLSALAKGLQALGKPDSVLVIQRTEIVDGDLAPLNARWPRHASDRVVPRLGHPCFWVVPGMIQTVQARLIHDFDWQSRPRDYITQTWPRQAHDKWICMMANAIGSTLYLQEPVVLYRRHASSVTGFKPDGRRFRRLRMFLSEGDKDYNYLAEVAQETEAYLERVAAQSGPDHGGHLRECALEYRHLTQVMSNRRAVWAGGVLKPRVSAVMDNIRHGAYRSKRGFRVGFFSLIKDVVRLGY